MTTPGAGAPAFWTTPRIAVLVVAIGFTTNFVARGIVDTYMVLMVALELEFGWRHSDLTRVYSIYLITVGIMSPFTGAILDGWGPRISYVAGLCLMAAAMALASQSTAIWQLFLAIGVMCGLASSLIGMVPASALVSRWFDRRMSLGIAIAYAGFGSGMLLIVPLAQKGIELYGWRETYLFMAASLCGLIPLLLALPWTRIAAGAPGNPRARRAAAGMPGGEPAATAQWTIGKAARTAEFWLLVTVFFFTAVSAYITSIQVIVFLIDRGQQPIGAALAFGTAGMLSVGGVMISGWAMVRFGARRTVLVSFVGTFTGMAGLVLHAYWPHEGWVLLYVLAFGLSQGARGPIISALNARIFARGRVNSIYGLIFMLMSFGSALGAWLSGFLFDLTGDYAVGFVVASALVVVAASPFLVTRRLVDVRELPPPDGGGASTR